MPVVISHWQAKPLLQARQAGQSVIAISLDLNLTQSEVRLEAEGVVLPDGQRLAWEQVTEIAENEATCFQVQDSRLERIQFFSPSLNRFYSLMATERAPTMLLSGFTMHRIKGIDPHEDTQRKVRAIAPIIGRVLDVCTGLGYTAIAAAQTAMEVVTIELDPAALEVARRNPWSQALFHSANICQVLGDATEQVKTLETGVFSRIFHDPPSFRLAGELYSGAFYRELFRVMARGGRLFHYIGDPESTLGSSVAKGAMKRLQEAGFQQVTRKPEAFGLIASKR
jgi:predicted methyltransferase